MTFILFTIKLTAIFCSPVVVLLGQDQFNQSAVVVLGDKTSDNISPGDDISAVIGELITPCKTPRDISPDMKAKWSPISLRQSGKISV